ncbi:cryptochrome/photolyase family protein [Solimonas aquatica]|nr:deoxyribodipyrimidine photo-lyase [Solimonas aquatica]
MTALLWFRRDLRLTDNPALNAALTQGRLIPVYIHDEASHSPWPAGGAARWWLHHSLRALDGALRARGSRLIVRTGESLAVLEALLAETGAESVHWNRCYEPAAIARDTRIKQALQARGLAVHSQRAALWREPWELKTGAGEPYRVFTPFWRALSARLPELNVQPAPARLPPVPETLASETLDALRLLPRLNWADGFAAHWQPGEEGALRRLESFVDSRLPGYKTRRDFPAQPGVSGLSPHLHFGELSPQQIRAAVQRVAGAAPGADAEHFLRELGWREFAHHLLYHFPHTPEAPLYEKFAAFPWRAAADYAAQLRAWQQGLTGIPIVDAGMRELWHSGWMHNRVRMIVASFLTKNLLIPWQEGARWFWDTLLDADLANNTLGWQWSAGCGADAAPYFRIFNPLLQSQKFDAQGVYLRRWLPELAQLPDALIHAPWTASPAQLAAAKLRLDQDYPLPIVDLAASRARALAAYEPIKAARS